MRARALSLFVSSLLALLMAEFGARMLDPGEPLIRFSDLASASKDQGIGEEVGELFVADPELFWRLAPNVSRPGGAGPLRGVISNSQGLRDDADVPFAKPQQELRVLFLGDSTTFGWGLQHSETVSYQVERGLHERIPGVAIECLNAGVPGYTLYQGWRYLEREGLRYAPDLVVASFGFNDNISWRNTSDLELGAHQRAMQPPASLAWSRLAALVMRALAPPAPGDSLDHRTRLSPDEFESILGHLAESTAKRDIELLVLVGGLRINVDGSEEPAYRRPLQSKQYSFGSSHRFGTPPRPAVADAVPLLQRLSAEHGVEAVFMDHVHTTPLANAEIAALLVDRIAPWLFTRVEF